MKIKMHHSLKVAHEVVKRIDIPKMFKDRVFCKSWSNCREQGLCISVNLGHIAHWKKICVAECRNSDDIVVNYGFSSDFDMQTNQPSEKVWQNRKYFTCGNFEGAANFIRSEIMEYANEELSNALKYQLKKQKVA